jgi:hypothetical protein
MRPKTTRKRIHQRDYCAGRHKLVRNPGESEASPGISPTANACAERYTFVPNDGCPVSRYLEAGHPVHPRDSSFCVYHKCVPPARDHETGCVHGDALRAFSVVNYKFVPFGT